MESYLEMPNGKKLEGIKYYDIADAAMQIVNTRISEDEVLNNKFNEFKKDYKHFEPYLDFLIIHMGYIFYNPFIVEEGYFYGRDGKLVYVEHPNDVSKKERIYPKSDDKSLRIDNFSVDSATISVISPEGLCYKFDRESGYFHGMFFELILMNKMIYKRRLYEDYITCMMNKSSVYYNINVYFRDRLGYLQAAIYDDNTGHVLYNEELKTGYIDGIIKGIHEMYPKVGFEASHIPYNMIEESNEMKEEMSEIYDGRRIRF